MDAGEVQILKGPGLTVTSRRVITPDGELQVEAIGAPQLESSVMQSSATPLVASIGAIIFGLGLFGGGPLVWVLGLAIMAFSPAAKIKRPAYAVTVESGDARRSVYVTHSETDANLAMAALIEARKRSAT